MSEEKPPQNLVEVHAPTELPLPPNWTLLVHGSNLNKPQWQGTGVDQLNDPIFEVKQMGLSTIDKLEADEQSKAASGKYDTTKNYSNGEGTRLEMRVIFPQFHSRRPLNEQQLSELKTKYGDEFISTLMKLTDQVQWHNYKSGRHPLLPKGMKLVKLADEQVIGRGRIIQYIPEVLQQFYQQELAR